MVHWARGAKKFKISPYNSCFLMKVALDINACQSILKGHKSPVGII